MFWSKLHALAAGLFLAIALCGLTASSAAAIDSAYLGTWARSGAKCEDDRVMYITRDGLSGHEWGCTTNRAKREKSGWSLRLSCSAEGTDYALRLHWRLLKNGRLRETIDGKVREYSRCSTRAATESQPESFAAQCVACFNEAQQLVRSVGGYCPPDCVPVFSTMVCDSSGICHLPN